ncbi:acyl-CoA N-acyltransferase [Panus rudis PR-1116 ss-1]|nr:acyl-CoA N-acyltransferase [Panus rudis PR-1116 ss-1]
MSVPVMYDLLTPQDIDAAYAIERAGYPPDEAASLEAFRYRQQNAPDLFLGAYIPSSDGSSRTLIGYVCSTLSPSSTLTHESMSKHIPASSSVCIHSVCVHPDYRRKGIAVNLLKEYIRRLEEAKRKGTVPYERILLIVHEELRGLYEKAGFDWVGPSQVVHGSRPWFEMRRTLAQADASSAFPSTSPNQGLPAGLWDALQRASTRPRPTGKKLDEFPQGLQDVTEAITRTSSITNKFDLLCPRQGCGSIILKNGVATFVETKSVLLEPEGKENPLLPPLPPPTSSSQWWKVTPSAMAFENIGFSKNVRAQLPESGKNLKLLLCAECDLGPLGYCEEGGSEFWLPVNRVIYRQ